MNRRYVALGTAAVLVMAAAVAVLMGKRRSPLEPSPDPGNQQPGSVTLPPSSERTSSGPRTSPPQAASGVRVSPPAPLSPEDFAMGLARLRAATLAGDTAAIRVLMAQLSILSSRNEETLWLLLKNPGTSDHPHFLLLVGGILGRIATVETLERAMAYSEELGPPGHFPGYDNRGSPTQARAILNALLSNMFREFLLREDVGLGGQERLLEWVKDDSLDPAMRQISLMTILSTRGSPGSEAVVGMFDTTTDAQLRAAIVSAMATTGSPDAVIPLVRWYEAHPELRGRIAEALATHLSPDVAMRLLIEQAQEEMASGNPSPALGGVAWLGRREEAFEVLFDTAKFAADPLIRRQCVDALSSSPSKLALDSLIEIARTETEGSVRAAVYGALALRAEAAIAFDFLNSSYLTDSDPTARQAIVLGMVHVLSTGGKTSAPAMAIILDDIRTARGVRGANLVQLSIDAATKGRVLPDFRDRLRAVEPDVKDGLTKKAIVDALSSSD